MAQPLYLERITHILDRLSSLEGQLSSLSQHVPGVQAPFGSASPSHTYRLRISSFTTRWFTKRFFPEFVVEAVDGHGAVCKQLPPGTVLSVRLLNGHGLPLEDCLNVPSPMTFSFVNGKATVTGVKFMSVSSRHGGSFRFELSCMSLSPSPVKSDKVRILSERLKNEQKVDSLLELRASDPITRIPGIGKRYTQKLAEQGIITVRDLALVDCAPSNRLRRLELLSAIRKDRGALTEAKLVELLRDARQVLKRDSPHELQTLPETSPQPSPKPDPPMVFPPKTLTMEYAEFGAPLILPEDSDLYMFNMQTVSDFAFGDETL